MMKYIIFIRRGRDLRLAGGWLSLRMRVNNYV